jgi:hypothetical protein
LEALAGEEADVLGVRHHHVRHHTGLETAHAVGQDHGRHPGQFLKHSTSRRKVVSRRWSLAKRTKRQRLQASTAQNL